ncbi:MAG: sporulation protein YqfD [Oscillospiraceae bacterium]|jgi:similar to stage IV sporulation protein|nr:sporulation protein YqfD [Oscillospiraceae bacterium]
MLTAIRYVLGFASFTVKGKNVEKFLSRVIKDGINIWDIRKDEYSFYGRILAKDFKNLRDYKKKAEIRIKLRKKIGLPFLFNKYKKRPGLIIGPVCFYLIIQFLSLFIWNINIAGNNKISEREIIKTMEKLGVKVGSRIKSLDTELLEKKMLIKIKNISWISITAEGSCLNVEINEKKDAINILSKNKPCNIVAAKQGQITRMQIFEGTATVKVGDAVAKGDLLVSGFLEDYYFKSSARHAEAKIYAITKHNITEKLNLNQILEVPTGKIINRINISFFGIKIPITLTPKPGENYKKELIIEEIKIGNSFLPIVLYKEKCVEKERKVKVLNFQEARKKALEDLQKIEETRFKGEKIIKRDIKDELKNGVYYSKISYVCEEDVAQKQEILIN